MCNYPKSIILSINGVLLISVLLCVTLDLAQCEDNDRSIITNNSIQDKSQGIRRWWQGKDVKNAAVRRWTSLFGYNTNPEARMTSVIQCFSITFVINYHVLLLFQSSSTSFSENIC